jgi:NAD(P)-dependent dehydrogenase (short-subunit alcohol dehydrogenase family)
VIDFIDDFYYTVINMEFRPRQTRMDIMKSQSTQGKVVLITGCSSGIGRATAVFLARQGCRVYATVRKEKDADALRQLSLPGLIPLCPLDLPKPDDIRGILSQVKDDLSRRGEPGLAALINNAGGGAVAPIELMDLAVFAAEVQARLVGTVALTQAFLPLLRAGAGRIIWVVTPAIIPTPYVTSIHACDFAVNCLARTLEIELKPWHIPNIQVRCGGIKTAKGLQTTAEIEAVLRQPGADLYRERLTRWQKEMTEFDDRRVEPEEVAQVIWRALMAAHPQRRYRIGHMAGAAALLEALPQPLTDAVLGMRF